MDSGGNQYLRRTWIKAHCMPWNEATWKKYLEGKATQEELKELEQYFQSGNLEEWNTLMAASPVAGGHMPVGQEQKLRQYLLQHMQRTGSRKARVLTLRRVAAAAAVIVLISTGWLALSRRQKAASPVAGAVNWDTIGRPVNAIRRLTLPDGTKVWLNRQASLLISKTYARERRVCLDGEGFFEVTHDAAHPFSVQTGQVNTKVLGTIFNVEQTSTDQAVRVSLVKGKVKVMHQQDTVGAVTLLPGNMAVAGNTTIQIATAPLDADPGAWIKGDLVMNNIPLADALHKLATYYNIQIADDRRLTAGKMVTALYHRNQAWPQVLQHALFIAQLAYTTDKDGTIHIVKK